MYWLTTKEGQDRRLSISTPPDYSSETLISEYDFERSPDTPSTWRIGDGTAAFYNYVYYTLAGFTENDTFRSNQVRHGAISREEALSLTAEENKPRYQSIYEYLQAIELDDQWQGIFETIATQPKVSSATSPRVIGLPQR